MRQYKGLSTKKGFARECVARIIYDRIMLISSRRLALNFSPIDVREKINEAHAIIITTSVSKQTFCILS